MIDGKKVLAVITARGGSKGVPGKNIRPLGGKPLIAWTIEAARGSAYIDRMVLSSDDAEIIRVAQEWGCEVPFVRPAELARDETPGIAPVLHAIAALPGYDYVVLLQPTSPLRTTGDIDGCIEMCARRGAPVCVSVCEASDSPYWMYIVAGDGRMSPLLNSGKDAVRRQDLPKVYVLNGAVYVADSRWLTEYKTFVSPEALAFMMSEDHSIDIDEEIDLLCAEAIIQRYR